MTPALLGLAWAGVVVAAAWSRRPAPARLRRLTVERAAAAAGAGLAAANGEGSGLVPQPGVLERVGRWVLLGPGRRLGRRRLGRHRVASGAADADPLTCRRVGGAVIAAAVGLAIAPVAAVPAAVAAWALPGARARRAERARLAALAGELPEVVDLFVLAVGAGLTVPLALAAVAAGAPGALAVELARVLDEVSIGRRLADALDDLPARAGDAVRPLVAALLASERYGAPLGAGLERLADEVRRERRRRAEEAARKVPVKLLFPLVTCTLPAFGLLTVTPLVAGAVRSLRF